MKRLIFSLFIILLIIVNVSCTYQLPNKLPEDDIDVFDEYDKLSIDEIKTYLTSIIPSEVTTDLTLPIGIPNSSASIYWQSTPSLISAIGIVSRGVIDQAVDLIANIRFHDQLYQHTIPVIIKGMELKPMENKKIVMAYYYDAKYFDIPNEQLAKIDYINYSFATINSQTYQLNLTSLYNLQSVLKYREQGIRIGLAIGGWGADGFSQALRTSANRAILIASIMDTIKKFQFDGIDLDWEYPTVNTGGIASHPSDKSNLTIFVKDLKQAMIAYRSDLKLTIAVISGGSAASFYDIAGLVPYIDYFNLMTYDGGSQAYTSHHTNLYNYPGGVGSVQSSVNQYMSLGVPKEKIIIGAAFYGHKKTILTTDGGILGKPANSNGSTDFTTINNLYLNNRNFTRYFDEQAKAPYLSDGKTFISYDDPISIDYKGKYVIEEDLAGMMFWELGSDKTFSLLEAINKCFNKK